MSDQTKPTALLTKISSLSEYDKLTQRLVQLKDEATRVGEEIRILKAENNDSSLLHTRIAHLKKLKIDIEKLTKEWRRADPDKLNIDRKEFEQFLIRRFFVVQSFEIHDSAAGLYDFGPPACAIKSQLLDLWRKHFVQEENMLEIDTPALTPSKVFEVSGHVSRFTDFIVYDTVKREGHRADKLIKQVLEKRLDDPNTTSEQADKYARILGELDGYDQQQMSNVFKENNIVSPEGNALTEPEPFNLMFQTSIGPTGKLIGYMRPETAQGIFVNFRRLLEYNGGQVPFAAACIGQAYRNEISPRASLLRVREFTLAEIEHFMHPEQTQDHPKWDKVKDLRMPLLSRENQTSAKRSETMSLEEAFSRGIIKNKTHAYFLGRVYKFMRRIGILDNGIQFRQHLQCEMAHYATDCWDCELLTSYGWIECVGIADRSAYDLTAHSDGSGVDLSAREEFAEPVIENVIVCEPNKKVFGPLFKKNAKKVTEHLLKMSNEEKLALGKQLKSNGKASITVDGENFELPENSVVVEERQEKITGRNFIPSVIEPSFGIGRIIYCLLEQTYWIREDVEGKNKLARSVLSLPASISPYKCVVLPLTQDSSFHSHVKHISDMLRGHGITFRVDSSNVSVGRRYARTDDIGVPYAITIDTENTIHQNNVTLRERDSCEQIIVPIKDLVQVIDDLSHRRLSWVDAKEKYAEQQQTASEKVGKKE